MLKRSLIAGVITLSIATPASAATITLQPTVFGEVIDDAGGTADGTFDRIRTDDPVGGGVEAAASGNFTHRAIMEFDLSTIPTGSVVNAAALQWEIGNTTNPPVDIELHGYAGDGIIAIGDAGVSNLIATASVPQCCTPGSEIFSIPVASLLEALVAGNNSFAGFMLRLPTEPPASGEEKTQFRMPVLGVRFEEPAPIPLPAAFPLFGTSLGILGLLGWRRRRKAEAAS